MNSFKLINFVPIDGVISIDGAALNAKVITFTHIQCQIQITF